MELRSDFSSLLAGRAENPEYYNGELVYYSPGGDITKLSVRVIARGNFRRNPEYCSFPPLFVNFRNGEVTNTLFDNQKKLKLVTPCQGDEDVVEEYLIYKMYNEVTDQSMKVRLAKISYFDTGTGKEVFERYSFFLEDKERTANRNDAIAKDRFVTPFDLNRESYKKMVFFQYIIGNKDWYIASRKNVVIMQPNDPSVKPIAVPYDFDMSGFVNAEYSKPKDVPDYLLSSKRVYKGLCYTDDELKEIFAFYEELKPKFESIINSVELLTNYNKKQILRYINHFYTVIKSKALIKREFLGICETPGDYNLFEVSQLSQNDENIIRKSLQ
jgi:uncharacterized protein YktA (UPF0223 family)